jgi:hypothetical protein
MKITNNNRQYSWSEFWYTPYPKNTELLWSLYFVFRRVLFVVVGPVAQSV